MIQKKSSSKISRRVQLLLLSYTIMIMFIISILAGGLFTQEILKNIKVNLNEKSLFTLYSIEQKLDRVIDDVRVLSENSELINGVIDTQGNQDYLPKLLEKFALNDNVNFVSLKDYKGQNLYTTGNSKGSHSFNLGAALNSGLVSMNIDESELIIISPVLYYNTPQAALIVSINFHKIAKEVTQFIHDSEFVLFSNEREIMSLGNKVSSSAFSIELETDNINTPRLHELGISSQSRIEEQVYLSPIWELITWFVGVLFVSILLALILGFMTTERLLQPIHLLVDKVSNANDKTKLFPLGTDDELEDLAKAFDKKTEALSLSNFELEKRSQYAEKANETKSMFLANMSHELRTPMHAISSFTNIILKNEQDIKKKQYLENIKLSATRLTKLLNNLLDLSKLESGKMQIDFVKQNVVVLISQSITEVASLLDDKSISISFQNTEPVECLIDSALFVQVVINLLSNAIKFSPDHSSIKIELSYEKQSNEEINQQAILLSITDQGLGVPKDELESIFDQFVESTETRSMGGGTGLGLPISKEIVELHQGKIWVESPPAGQVVGSAFHIMIPVDH